MHCVSVCVCPPVFNKSKTSVAWDITERIPVPVLSTGTSKDNLS